MQEEMSLKSNEMLGINIDAPGEEKVIDKQIVNEYDAVRSL